MSSTLIENNTIEVLNLRSIFFFYEIKERGHLGGLFYGKNLKNNEMSVLRTFQNRWWKRIRKPPKLGT